MGNPHAIFWVDDVNAYDLARFGPLLENHPVFPERANITLAHIVDRDHITMRTWERGAGLTKACGSAACAAAVAVDATLRRRELGERALPRRIHPERRDAGEIERLDGHTLVEAAERVYLTQSALSRQVKAIEDALGAERKVNVLAVRDRRCGRTPPAPAPS